MRPPEARTAETPGRTHVSAASGAAASLLALQRSAGNAAVAGWLQRDAKLEDVGAAAKDLIVDTEPVRLSGLPVQFKNPRVAARPGLTVQTEFGGEMAATPDPKTEKTLRTGLESIAMIIFGLDADLPPSPDMPPAKGPRRPPRGTRVNIKDLDLTRWGGDYGALPVHLDHPQILTAASSKRLTCIRLRAARGAARAVQEVERTRRLCGANSCKGRFDRFGDVRRCRARSRRGARRRSCRGSTDEFGMVLQALAFVPEAGLAGRAGHRMGALVRARGPQGRGGLVRDEDRARGGRQTGAQADRQRRRVPVRLDDLIKLVAHEIGHAISNKPAETGGMSLADKAGPDGFKAAAAADGGTAISPSVAKTDALHETYAEAYSMFVAEPATPKAIRPRTFAWFAKQQADAEPNRRRPPRSRRGPGSGSPCGSTRAVGADAAGLLVVTVVRLSR